MLLDPRKRPPGRNRPSRPGTLECRRAPGEVVNLEFVGILEVNGFAFLEDESPDAYEKVVGRLLASKAYAERWGRKWLDD